MKWLKDNLGEIWAIFLYVFLTFATIFGIYRGFHKGVGNGVASILMPPWAWYNTLAYTWEKPDWKLQYENETSNMAIALMADKSKKVDEQVEMSEVLLSLRAWVKNLPKDEQAKLKAESERLCDAWVVVESQMMDNIINNRALVDIHYEFQSIPSYEKEFKNSLKQSNVQLKSLLDNVDASQLQSNEIKNRFEAFLTMEKLDKSQRLEKIFSN